MALWIRSQTKCGLAKTTILYITRSNDDEYNINNEISVIGVYKTKERALEVLDEIQNILMPREIKWEDLSTKEQNKLLKKWELMPVGAITNVKHQYVYEMPEE